MPTPNRITPLASFCCKASASALAAAALMVIAPAVYGQTATLDQLAQRLAIANTQVLADCGVLTAPYSSVTKTIIPQRVGRIVTIGMQADEVINTVTWDEPKRGDLVEPFVHPDHRTVSVRLKVAAPVPGVISTDKRRYFIQLTPSDAVPGSICYQGVLFTGADSGTGGDFNPFGTTVSPTGVGVASVSEVVPQDRPNNDVFTGQPNFGYTITGDVAVKPTAVYDNGRFTWIAFPKSVQELPAVFYDGPNGLEVVNWTPLSGNSILVNRLMGKFVLKLNGAEATVSAGGSR